MYDTGVNVRKTSTSKLGQFSDSVDTLGKVTPGKDLSVIDVVFVGVW